MVKEIIDVGEISTPNMFDNREQALQKIEDSFIAAREQNPNLTPRDFMTQNYDIKKSMHENQKSWIVEASTVLDFKYRSK
jgi:hypothetical protein